MQTSKRKSQHASMKTATERSRNQEPELEENNLNFDEVLGSQ